MTSENKTYQSKNNCENSIHKNQEMDYLRPPSNRVKIAPARFRSNEENLEKNEQKEETNNLKTINRKRKLKGENLSKEPENESEPKQKLTKISKMTKDKEIIL